MKSLLTFGQGIPQFRNLLLWIGERHDNSSIGHGLLNSFKKTHDMKKVIFMLLGIAITAGAIAQTPAKKEEKNKEDM